MCKRIFQVLNTRLHAPVWEFVDELEGWVEDGYVNAAVWQRLQKHVSRDIISNFKRPTENRSTQMTGKS